jgi:hypothetical protein
MIREGRAVSTCRLVLGLWYCRCSKGSRRPSILSAMRRCHRPSGLDLPTSCQVDTVYTMHVVGCCGVGSGADQAPRLYLAPPPYISAGAFIGTGWSPPLAVKAPPLPESWYPAAGSKPVSPSAGSCLPCADVPDSPASG